VEEREGGGGGEQTNELKLDGREWGGVYVMKYNYNEWFLALLGCIFFSFISFLNILFDLII
jgi:hypothetical protein